MPKCWSYIFTCIALKYAFIIHLWGNLARVMQSVMSCTQPRRSTNPPSCLLLYRSWDEVQPCGPPTCTCLTTAFYWTLSEHTVLIACSNSHSRTLSSSLSLWCSHRDLHSSCLPSDLSRKPLISSRDTETAAEVAARLKTSWALTVVKL